MRFTPSELEAPEDQTCFGNKHVTHPPMLLPGESPRRERNNDIERAAVWPLGDEQ